MSKSQDLKLIEEIRIRQVVRRERRKQNIQSGYLSSRRKRGRFTPVPVDDIDTLLTILNKVKEFRI